MIRDRRFLFACSALEGALLGVGLETCFGVGQYRKIMLLGAAGGLGIGALAWLARLALDRGRRDAATTRRVVLAAAAPGLAVFAVWFLARILPLIREELSYSL